MANINLIIAIANSGINYVNSTVRYGRIDNTPTPTYTTINAVVTTPLVIQNVPAGQYRIYAKPNYADGRICPEQMIETEECIGITSLNATYTNPNIVVDYTCDPDVPKVKITVNYPNGGFTSTIVDNDSTPVNVLIPSNVFGTYLVSIQPCCDEDTGWFGSVVGPTSVDVEEPSP